MYYWKEMTVLFASLTTGWLLVLWSLVLQARVLDMLPQDQHVNTWVWLASTVTNSSAFCIEGGLTAADLLRRCFIGMPTPVAVLQNYTMLNAFDMDVPHCYSFRVGNGCTPRNITNSIGGGLSPPSTP